MSETLRNAIGNVTGRIENRRVQGILRKTPGALGEPPTILDVIEENTVYVSRTEINDMIEREVYRHVGNIQKADPVEMQRRVDKWIENQTLLRKLQNEP